jgi:hypothetical protein
MEEARLLREDEKKLIIELIKQPQDNEIAPFDLSAQTVVELKDGGMGSLYFVDISRQKLDRRMLKCVAELQFDDDDGVPILTSLNIDQDGKLFELDIWKVDYSPVIKYPAPN